MFDLDLEKILVIIIVAVVVIGPKDMPLALRTAGRWIGKMRRVSGHFRSGIENMIREAELEEMEKTWREQNAAILQTHPAADFSVNEQGQPAASPAEPAPAAHELPPPVSAKPKAPRAKKAATSAKPNVPKPSATKPRAPRRPRATPPAP